MMTEQEALRKADEAIRSSNTARAAQDARWAVSLAYARGAQWRYQASTSPGTQTVKRLHEIMDPRRADVRVTMDVIGQTLRRIVAQLKPVRIQSVVYPRGRSPKAMVARQVYTGAMTRILEGISAVPIWRSLHWPRCVLGDMMVRRQLTTEGKPVMLPADYKGEDGKPLHLYKRVVKWAPVLPFYIIRDSSAIGQDFHAESIFGHEVPRSLDWLQLNFGVKLEEDRVQTMGQLYQHMDAIRRVTGYNLLAPAAQSNVKGVVVYEFYFQDGSTDAPAGWPWQLICYRDPETNDLKTLHFGKNPFYGLPFHRISYGQAINDPWCDGVPALMKSHQDVRNMAATAMVRVMLEHYPKWRVVKNSVEGYGWINRTDLPVEWTPTDPRNPIPPERLPAVGASPVADSFWNSLGQEAMNAANLAPVQTGTMVKRGQAASAYQSQIEQANVPLDDLIRDDELTLNELLYATLVDTGNLTFIPRRDVAYAMLGDDFPSQQIDEALSEPPTSLIQSVKVVPENLRPKTPRQVQDDFVMLSQAQLVDPLAARREMLSQGDVITDSIMAESVQQQEMELAMMEGGQDCQVAAGQDHSTSMWVIERLQSSPRWYALAPEAQDAILQHWALHKNTLMELASLEGAGMNAPPTGRPSPPAEPAEHLGAVGPQMQVA